MKSGEHYKAWNCAERQKGVKGNGCKCRIVKEEELITQVCAALGWTELDEERFEACVSRVLVMDEGVKVEMRKALRA